MAKLACEVCGGRLEAKPDGMFECEFCGMRYDKTKIQQMVQEIRGTVKVEGTVQVQGSVQVQGAATAASLTEKVFQDMASGRFWDETRASLNRALEADPNYGDAHLAFAMLNKRYSSREEFWKDMLTGKLAPESLASGVMDRMMKANGSDQFMNEIAAYQDHLNRRQAAAEARRAAGKDKVELFAKLRREYAPAARLLTQSGKFVLKTDGTCLAEGDGAGLDHPDWQNMVEIVSPECRWGRYLAGRRADGSVWALCRVRDQNRNWKWTPRLVFEASEQVTELVMTWGYDSGSDVCGFLGGMKQNGELVCWQDGISGDLYRRRKQTENWSGVTCFSADGVNMAALRKDGSVVCAGEKESGELLPSGSGVVQVLTYNHTRVFLHADGTITSDHTLPDEVLAWTDLLSITWTEGHLVGLRADGTVVTNGTEEMRARAEALRDIVAVKGPLAVGKNGKVNALTGKFGKLEGAVLFDDVSEIEPREQKLKEKMAQARQEKLDGMRQALAALKAQQQALTEERDQLKGFFSGKRRAELQAQLDRLSPQIEEAEQELKKMEGK